MKSLQMQSCVHDEGTIEWERGADFGYLPQESAPVRDETIRTKTETADGLLHELSRRHALDLSTTRLAVNDEFASGDQPLRPGDKIALLPPFSGG